MSRKRRRINRAMRRKLKYGMLACLCAMSMMMTACGTSNVRKKSDPTEEVSSMTDDGSREEEITASDSTGTNTANGSKNAETVVAESLDVSDMFTNRDKEVGYDETTAVKIRFDGDEIACNEKSVAIVDGTVTITEEGTYVLNGTLNDGCVIIDADHSDKVQLVLNGVDISNRSGAAIYVKQADKVFITTAAGSENTLTNSGEFVPIDDSNIDAVIFSKDDITLNGEGTLIVQSEYGHGIVSKDDLVITCGTYVISAASHGLSGKDSVRIANGDIQITCGKDGIHSGNDEDDTVGYTYIADGNITIDAEDDGIHSDTKLLIAGGNMDIVNSHEGLEGQVIEIAGGHTRVNAEDDGINASGGNANSGNANFGNANSDNNHSDRGRFFGGMMNEAQEGVYLLISGGYLEVNAAGDGLDSNGDLFVTGGETYVTGAINGGNGPLDYAGDAQITGGILVAAGHSGMEQNMGSSSTQGSILQNAGSMQEVGSTVELKDAGGKVLVSYSPSQTYNSVVISCPEIAVGETYTLMLGTESYEINMTNLIYGTGNGFGGFGGRQPGEWPDEDDFGGRHRGRGEDVREFDETELEGERPKMPENEFDMEGKRPEMPENGFDMEGERPEMPKKEFDEQGAD